MTFHDTTTELRNYLRTNYDDTNVTAAQAGERPVIIKHDESKSSDSSGLASLGEIRIGQERRLETQKGYYRKDVTYEIDIEVRFPRQTDRTLATQTMTELERIIGKNTLTNFDRTELLPATSNNNTKNEVIEFSVALYDRLQTVARG